MILLSLCGAVIALILLVPTVSDLISAVRLAFGPRLPKAGGEAFSRLLILVPAHNEEALIASCIASLRAQRYPPEHYAIHVIADNCTDNTAALARAAGAHCLERHDLTQRGKPHAIAWALERLPIADFDALVIVDADAVVDPGFAAGIAAAAPLRAQIVQGYNDVHNRTDNAITRMAAVLSAANHRFAFGLKTRVGLNVPLGTGVAVGTDVLAAHGWKAFSIGEDWELYALMTERGVRTRSAPAARIFAEEARSLRQSASQRHRWAAGKLTVLFRYAWRLLRSPHIGAPQKLDVLAELLGPGPAVHLGLVAVMSAALLLTHAPGAVWVTAALAASLVRPAVYTLIALTRDPEPGRAALAFGFLPFYTLWRLGVQVTALRMLGDKPWVRTERNPLAKVR